MSPLRSDYLKEKVRPYKPAAKMDVEGALEALQGCSFQGRNVGIGLEVWHKMVQDNALKVLTLSGAMVPAGLAEVICVAIEHKFIDAIITTGANLTHDLINALLGQSHFLGTDEVDDCDLRDHKIDRIYDTYIPETLFDQARAKELALLREIYGSELKCVQPSKVFREVGTRLADRSVVSVAARNGVPIFCGATSDSDFGLMIAEARMKGELNLVIDEIADVIAFGELIKTHSSHGTIIIGGGVPRNWGQQVFPFLEQMKVPMEEYGYRYSVRIHTATVYDGGLSGCTVSESKTWGKYAKDAEYVSIWSDATIVFPLLVTALLQRVEKAGAGRSPRVQAEMEDDLPPRPGPPSP